MQLVKQLFLVLSLALAHQGHPAVSEPYPEGSCLSWGGCTDAFDEPVSGLQVMLQVQERGRKRRLEPSAESEPRMRTARASAQMQPAVAADVARPAAAPVSLQARATVAADVASAPWMQPESASMNLQYAVAADLASIEAAPVFVQMTQETHHAAAHHSKAKVDSASHRNDASPGIPAEGGPAEPAILPSEHAAAAEPELQGGVAALLTSYGKTATPLLKWADSFSMDSMYTEGAAAIIAFCAALYAILCTSWRRHASKIWPEASKQEEQPKHVESPGSEPPSFMPPKLLDAAASFAVPLVSLANCCKDAVSFNITEASGAVLLRAMLTRLPPSGSWAKVEIFAGLDTTAGASSLLASCSLAGSAADIEHEIVTGALKSWLSLLINDRSDIHEPNDPLNEDVNETVPPMHTESVSNETVSKQESVQCRRSHQSPHPLPHLEVKDGLGSVLGSLEPNADGCYSLWQHGQTALEIKSYLHDHQIALQKDGKDYALAAGIPPGGSPECTGAGPEEFLQVDVLSHAKSQESVLILICILVIIALDASGESDNV